MPSPQGSGSFWRAGCQQGSLGVTGTGGETARSGESVEKTFQSIAQKKLGIAGQGVAVYVREAGLKDPANQRFNHLHG
jgi:hypothetical protein